MSNSIWKTPDQKPEKNKQILEHWKNCYGEDKYAVWIADGERGFDSHTVRWCYCEYVDDLIAQADKAERLQKAVDLARDKYADIATKYISTLYRSAPQYWERHIADCVSKYDNEIKQLIKENQ